MNPYRWHTISSSPQEGRARKFLYAILAAALFLVCTLGSGR